MFTAGVLKPSVFKMRCFWGPSDLLAKDLLPRSHLQWSVLMCLWSGIKRKTEEGPRICQRCTIRTEEAPAAAHKRTTIHNPRPLANIRHRRLWPLRLQELKLNLHYECKTFASTLINWYNYLVQILILHASQASSHSLNCMKNIFLNI